MSLIVNPAKTLELLCLASVVAGCVMVQAQPAYAGFNAQPQAKTETVSDSGLTFPVKPGRAGRPDRRQGAGSR